MTHTEFWMCAWGAVGCAVAIFGMGYFTGQVAAYRLGKKNWERHYKSLEDCLIFRRAPMEPAKKKL